MFDALTDKLQGVFSGLKGRGKLTEADIDQAMRAIRLSLLEADVSLPVVKQLTTAIAARAKGAEVMDSLTPDQQVVKIVSEELTTLMGEANVALPLASKPPTIVLMAGLQGRARRPAAPSWPATSAPRGARPCSWRATSTGRRPRSSWRCWASRSTCRCTASRAPTPWPSPATASRRPGRPAVTW